MVSTSARFTLHEEKSLLLLGRLLRWKDIVSRDQENHDRKTVSLSALSDVRCVKDQKFCPEL